jgi:hypothetical protein
VLTINLQFFASGLFVKLLGQHLGRWWREAVNAFDLLSVDGSSKGICFDQDKLSERRGFFACKNTLPWPVFFQVSLISVLLLPQSISVLLLPQSMWS